MKVLYNETAQAVYTIAITLLVAPAMIALVVLS